MYNVIILGGTKTYIEELERSDIWEKHSDMFRITHSLADGNSNGETFKIRDAQIIIMDTDMDKPNGFSILRSINEDAQCACVILTGERADFKTIKKALVLGAFDYLVKPLNEDELFATLKRAAARLNRLHESRFHAETDSLCADIAASVLSGGHDLDHRIHRLLSASAEDRPPGEGSANDGMRLQTAAVTIYQEVCKNLQWIGDLIPEPQNSVQGIHSANSRAADEVFLRFICGLSDTVNKYQPSDLNGVTELAVAYILENRFSKLTLADTAEKCFVNKAHLSHIFKQNLGLSFTEYVKSLKMEMLRKMMISSNKQLKEIAEILGYDDYKYMARIFKSTYGIAPSEFRNDPDLLENS